MAPNLWAQLDQQNQAQAAPPPPSVFAPTEMTGPPPDMGAPTAPPIARMPTMQEQNMAYGRGQLQKLQDKDARPWGFAGAAPSPEHPEGLAPNHPGKLGKIAHVFSQIGNIAGDIVAPDVMAHIPGTQMNREVEENRLTHQLDQENTENEQNLEREAQTAKANEDTAEAPGKNAREEANTTSEIASRDQATDVSKNNLVNTLAHYVQADLKAGKDPNANPIIQALHEQINQPTKPAATKGTEHVFLSDPTGKPYAASFDPNDSSYHDATGKVIANPVPYEKPITIHTGGETPYQQHEERRQLLTAFQPSLDSAERMNVMTDAYEKAVKGHDQQAMLNLLANHIGMTMGLAKGARITQHIYDEAAQSMPWIQKVGAKFDNNGYLSGVTLSVPQMQQMVGLAQERYAEDTGKSRSTAKYLGGNDDGPERHPGTSTKNYYLGKAGGDRNKAMQMMAEDGWTVPNGK